MAAVTTVPSPHTFDFNVWPLHPTNDWLINHTDLPNITDLDDLVFASEASHNENPMSYIDRALEITPSIPEIDNLIYSKIIQERIQPGLSSVVANAEINEPRLDAPLQLHPGTFTFSIPPQGTSAVDHSLHINDANKHKDSMSNTPNSLLATTPKNKITMEVDVKEELFSPKVEIKQDQQIEKSPG